VAVRITVETHGAIADGTADDRFQTAFADAIQEIVLRGEREAKLMAQPAPAGSFHTRDYAEAHGYFQTGHYNRSIHGRVMRNMNGEISDSGVVYGPWLEGVSSRNQSSRFRGYSIFRRTKDTLERISGEVVDHYIRRFIQSTD
jgi:hypothetical protein